MRRRIFQKSYIAFMLSGMPSDLGYFLNDRCISSHLLARRGMAERIGNLLGRLQFSDDQLQRTQKGLKDAGVAMPNFGNVGRELAKEINEEPEVDIETDDEREQLAVVFYHYLTVCYRSRSPTNRE
jgi:hypothetical protein